jgi:hypothetical protein
MIRSQAERAWPRRAVTKAAAKENLGLPAEAKKPESPKLPDQDLTGAKIAPTKLQNEPNLLEIAISTQAAPEMD